MKYHLVIYSLVFVNKTSLLINFRQYVFEERYSKISGSRCLIKTLYYSSWLKDFKSDHIIAIMTTENGNAAMINKF